MTTARCTQPFMTRKFNATAPPNNGSQGDAPQAARA